MEKNGKWFLFTSFPASFVSVSVGKCMHVNITTFALNVCEPCLCVFDRVVSTEIRPQLPLVPIPFLSPGLVEGRPPTSTSLTCTATKQDALTPRLLHNKSLLWHVSMSSATLSVCRGVGRWRKGVNVWHFFAYLSVGTHINMCCGWSLSQDRMWPS